MNSTLAFAFGAGMVSTVNPCGFAMLPAFLAYYLGSGDTDAQATLSRRIATGLRTGLAVSAGFVAVFTVVGLLVAAGLRFLIGACRGWPSSSAPRWSVSASRCCWAGT